MSEEEDEIRKFSGVVCAILCPPLSVWITNNGFSVTFMINIFLTLLFWFPGVLHAIYIIMNQQEPEEPVEPVPPEELIVQP